MPETSNRIRTDWRLFAPLLVILMFGLVMLYSASSVLPDNVVAKSGFDTQDLTMRQVGFVIKQSVFVLLGILVLLALKRIDYKRWQHPLWVFGPLSLAILLVIVAYFRDTRFHRWIQFPGAQLQPSEFAKPLLIVFLAYFVARRENAINSLHTLAPAGLVVLLLAVTVGAGDFGTAVIIVMPFLAMFWVAGLKKRYLAWALVLALFSAGVAIWNKPYRWDRVEAYVTGKGEAAEQRAQAAIAMGSGGLTGVGLGSGLQKVGFLPQGHTDFIFAVIGEEAGLVGCLTLMGAYLLIFWRGLRLYWVTPDVFGRYLALGVVVLVTSQALMNMGVAAGALPTKGLTLPLVSYGGSAMLSTLATFGLLLSVSDRS